MEYKNQDLQDMLCTGLRLTLEYLCVHAHLRELFTIQELLSRHAADVAWHQSQQSIGLPKDFQEMPAVLRAQFLEIERNNTALRTSERQRLQVENVDAPQP